jgi:putative ABC transport system permease protein
MHQKLYSIQIILSVAIGVGAVTGINSYRHNLHSSIEKEARIVMGGDLTIQASSPLTEDNKSAIYSSMPEKHSFAFTVNFPSMVYAIGSKETSLSFIKALGKEYPFYGEVVTKPANVYKELKDDEILLDENLSKNLKLNLGDKVSLGNSQFTFAGVLLKEQGVTGNFLAMAPSSIITLDALKDTGLEARGSRITYNVVIKLPEGSDSRKIKEEKFPVLIKDNLTLYHNTEIGSGTQRFINTTLDYLSLLGLSAFFLSSISIFLSCKTKTKSKVSEISVLKCIGISSNVYISLFTFELLFLSLLGVIPGILTAYYFQFIIPDLVGSDLLRSMPPSLNFSSVLWGLCVGLLVPIVAGLESMYKIKNLSPLNAIREENDSETKIKFIPNLSSIIGTLLIYCIFAFLATKETGSYTKGFSLSLALFILPVLIFLFYNVFRFFISFILKINLGSNTFRFAIKKVNKTGSGLSLPIIGITSSLSILMIAIILRANLLELGGARQIEKRPNMFVMDIKKDQLDTLQSLLKKYDAKQSIIAPVIGARLHSINHKTIQKESTEKDALKRDWRSTALVREYFLSYRQSLYDTESLVAGKFWEYDGQPEISVEKDFATNLGVSLGDSLQFNVQGIIVSGTITNTRRVNWSDMKPNFVVLFSPDALENAPGYYITSFLLEDREVRYQFQKELVGLAANATVVDIEKSIQAFQGILDKVTDIISLMTYFLVFSSVLLLISSIYSNRVNRIEESSLFRIVGASSGFVYRIYLYEAMFVGFTAYTISLVLSLLSNHILSENVLNLQYDIPLVSLLKVSIVVFVSVSIIYWLDVRNVLSKKSILGFSKRL